MSNKTNILIVNGHLNVGGVERSLVDVLKHIDYNKYSVDLLLLEGLGDYLNEIPDTVNIINKDTRPAFGPIVSVFLQSIRTKNWFAIKYRICILLAHICKKGIFQLLCRNVLNIKKNYNTAIAYRVGFVADIVGYGITATTKLCWWHHGCIQPSDNIKQLSLFHFIIAVSNGIKQILIDRIPQIKDNIIVIPNMVDVERINTMAIREKNPYQNYDGLKFVTIGRIATEKHIENVVTAAVRLREDGCLKFKWYIVGDGELFNYIQKMIQEANIEDHVILCGSKVNPYPYIKYADLMIHTSHIESQGLVILEAMALATPCVVTRSIGPSEFIIDGENGILVEPNIDSLIKGLYHLAENRQLQQTISSNSQITITQKYAPQTVINRIYNAINY